VKPAGTRRRSRRVLLVISLLAITLVTLDSAGAFEPVRSGASDVLAPVTDGVHWLTTPFRNAWAGMSGYGNLETENRRLRKQLDELKAKGITDSNDREQLKRLTAQLNIGFVGDIPTEVARVASGPRNNFEDHRLEIDKGSAAGLAVGMPVVTKAGLVGRLERVSRDRSVVQLATDPAFVIGVRVAQTQDLGIGHGAGTDKPFVVDRGIELTDAIKPGNAVVTSGLARAIMPPDIPVGLVSEVVPDPADSSLLLRVDFAAQFSQLDVVQVLKWTPPT